MAHSNDDFYRNLPLLEEFNAFETLTGFYPAPKDWLVVIADIKNSTLKVDAGQYKQVNMIGASCITAVLNALGEIDIPFIFGGDGATMLVPARLKAQVQSALVNVRALALEAFDIRLRIGFVAVDTIIREKRAVLVAKYQLSEGHCLAMFSGGGVDLADQLIKADTGCHAYAVTENLAAEPPDLTGLSCRWQPLQSSRGHVICLLIQALDDSTVRRHQLLSKLLTGISDILDDDITASNPVNGRSLKFKWPPAGLKIEALLTKANQSYLRRYVFLLYQSLIQAVLERFDLSAGHYNAPEYRKELQSNADYRRFDDALRLVLDCSTSQIDQITSLLQQHQQRNEIAFGLHKTKSAQMTCLIFSLKHHQHLHFVDGSDGGFWAASRGYKAQLKKG